MINPQQSKNDSINQIDEYGLKQGLWITYSTDTSYIIEQGKFLNNKKQGIWKAYFPNGILKSEITFIKDEPNGMVNLYHKNGKIKESGIWQKDHWVGDYKYFYKTGVLSYKWHYNKKGKREGEQKYFHENGKIMYQGAWKDGKAEGTLKVYNNNGELTQEKMYNDGKITTIKKASKPISINQEKTDTLLAEPSLKFSGTGFHTIYNLAGKIDEKGYFIEGDLYNGTKYHYNNEGKLISITSYKNGKATSSQKK
jgi:antitoxin component YwqK of YwqJK toxin-antitoxin module